MAGTARDWAVLLLVGELLVGSPAAQRVSIAAVPGNALAPPVLPPAGNLGRSQEGHGAISGRLTDLGSRPMPAVVIVARNETTGAETRTTTSRNGSYRLTGLDAGQYTLEALSPALGRGRLEGIYVAGGGYEAHVQAAMAFEPVPAETLAASASDVPADTSPHGKALEEAAGISPAVNIPEKAAALPNLTIEGRDARAREELPVSGIELRGELAQVPLRGLEIRGLPMSSRDGVGEPAEVPSGAATATTTGTALPVRGEEGTVVSALVAAAQGAGEFVRPDALPAKIAAEEPSASIPVDALGLSAAELEALPAVGRRWEDFLLDAPTGESGGLGELLSSTGIAAGRTSMDGASTALAFGGNGSVRSASAETGKEGGEGGDGAAQSEAGRVWSGGRGSTVAEAAIREVRAGPSSALAAEGRGGKALHVETAGGTNGLHGQAFGFDRQNTWGARNPFTQWVQQTAAATLTTTPVFTAEPYTPPDHETVTGFGGGSQIRLDKLFWFAALDSYSRNDPGLATVRHPDLFFAQPRNDQMQLLSAQLGLSGVNPVAEGVAAYSKLLTTLDGLLGPAARRATQWVGFARLDWAATERHRFTLESTGADWHAAGGGLTRVSEAYGSNSFGSSAASEELLLGRWDAFLTPNLLAVTHGSAGRTIQTAHAGVPSAFEQTFLSANTWGQLPQISLDTRDGFTIGNLSRFGTGSYPDEKALHGQEAVNWVHGSLQVEAGFELSHNEDATSLLRNETGTYSYASVENFASDALAFAAFGISGELNPDNPHDCDATGKAWRDGNGTLHGLGSLPCYSYYSQTLGPTHWNLSTNDWAGFSTIQWQASKLAVVSAGLRWEREQLPPTIAALANAALPLTGKLPALGSRWGPRVSLALGKTESHWPVLRLGYGLYAGRVENATVEAALTQTGSLSGDLNFFLRPTDRLSAGGAPPFPSVLSGAPGNILKPGVVEFAGGFRNPEVQQAAAALEEELRGHVQVTVSVEMSLGRLLPVSIDTNFDPAVNPGTLTYAVVDGSGLGPIKAAQLTVPFYASWPAAHAASGFAGRLNPNYQQITQMMSRANSTYEAAVLRIMRTSRRGLSLHARYTYAHAADWNPNESPSVAGSDVLDPAHFNEEYGTSDLDIRQSASVLAVVEAPWRLRGWEGRFANRWRVSGVGQYRSGLPFTMRTGGRLAEEFDSQNGAAIVALGPGMNGSGGDNRVYGVGRNTYRYPPTWKADLRLGKVIELGHVRQLEILVESFNLFNHQNVTELETTGYSIEPGDASGGLPRLNFLTGLKANTTEFGTPMNVNATNFYRERQIQLGVRLRF